MMSIHWYIKLLNTWLSDQMWLANRKWIDLKSNHGKQYESYEIIVNDIIWYYFKYNIYVQVVSITVRLTAWKFLTLVL